MLTKAQIQKIKSETSQNDNQLMLIFDALGDFGRFRIFRLLAEKYDLCVTDVAGVFGITLSAASQQLKILERVGLIEKTRMGQMVCYEINSQNPIVKQIIKIFPIKTKKVEQLKY